MRGPAEKASFRAFGDLGGCEDEGGRAFARFGINKCKEKRKMNMRNAEHGLVQSLPAHGAVELRLAQAWYTTT